MKKYETLKFQSMHCFVKSLIVLFIRKDMDIFYNNIVAALKTSGTECILMSHADKNSSFRPVAGWNEYVKEHYSIAKTHYGGGNIIINQIMVLFATT